MFCSVHCCTMQIGLGRGCKGGAARCCSRTAIVSRAAQHLALWVCLVRQLSSKPDSTLTRLHSNAVKTIETLLVTTRLSPSTSAPDLWLSLLSINALAPLRTTHCACASSCCRCLALTAAARVRALPNALLRAHAPPQCTKPFAQQRRQHSIHVA